MLKSNELLDEGFTRVMERYSDLFDGLVLEKGEKFSTWNAVNVDCIDFSVVCIPEPPSCGSEGLWLDIHFQGVFNKDLNSDLGGRASDIHVAYLKTLDDSRESMVKLASLGGLLSYEMDDVIWDKRSEIEEKTVNKNISR